MKRLILALALIVALAVPSFAAQRVFLVGELVNEINEDGQTYKALKLTDGSILTKKQQHGAEMSPVGNIPGKGKAFDWLDTKARADALKNNASFLGMTYEDLAPGDAEYILEVNVPGPPDEWGKPTVIRKKVADAKAEGIDTSTMEKIKPHEWQN